MKILKIGIVMVVGIAMLGMMMNVSAYTSAMTEASNEGEDHCFDSDYSPSNNYVVAECDKGWWEGEGDAWAHSGDGKDSHEWGAMCCPPGTGSFTVKARAGGMSYRYVWVGCE